MWSCEICASTNYSIDGERELIICSRCDNTFPVDSRVEYVTVEEEMEDSGVCRNVSYINLFFMIL